MTSAGRALFPVEVVREWLNVIRRRCNACVRPPDILKNFPYDDRRYRGGI